MSKGSSSAFAPTEWVCGTSVLRNGELPEGADIGICCFTVEIQLPTACSKENGAFLRAFQNSLLSGLTKLLPGTLAKCGAISQSKGFKDNAQSRVSAMDIEVHSWP